MIVLNVLLLGLPVQSYFVPIYQFAQITSKRPFWCRAVVLLRASILKHSARLIAQTLSLSQGAPDHIGFFGFGVILVLVPEHLPDKNMVLPP